MKKQKKTKKTDYKQKYDSAVDITIDLALALREATVVIELQNNGNKLVKSIEALERYEDWINQE